MIAFDQYNYCVFFGVNFSYSKSPTERLPYAEDFPFERVFCRYSKQLHQLSKVPNEYLLYCLSSQSQKPPPVYHFFPKISLSFSCFLLRIPYTIPRKSNKNWNQIFIFLPLSDGQTSHLWIFNENTLRQGHNLQAYCSKILNSSKGSRNDYEKQWSSW